MKRRNFFKSLAALAVIPVLPEPKEGFISAPGLDGKPFKIMLDKAYFVGTWSSKGAIYPNGYIYGKLAGKPVRLHNIPRHEVNSFEYVVNSF